MKKLFGIVVSSALFAFSAASHAAELPKGAIKEGSLSNKKLIQDAMAGVAMKVAAKGCDKPESLLPYVLEMPKGEPGLRFWTELWVVKGCGSEYPIKVKFNEAGLDAANYVIEN